MKKILSVTLALLICCCFFTSCKKDEKNNNENVEYESIFNEKAQAYADNKLPVAVIIMESGDAIVLELYPDIAENTVNNFIALANKGFYDGTIFHRCMQDFMIQGGDPQGTGMGGPGYTIEGEFTSNNHTNNLSHTRGVLSMARRGGTQSNPALGYNTAGSQFFICVADCTSLDGDYASFGKVLDGMNVVDKIVAQETDSSDRPINDQVIKYLRVECFGVAYDEPVTISE